MGNTFPADSFCLMGDKILTRLPDFLVLLYETRRSMQTFTSDISGKSFPDSEKTSGKLVRNGILKEILKINASFTEDCFLSVVELNHYRQQYIQNLLAKEVGTLTELEQTVLDNIQHNHILADEASEVKQDRLNSAQRWADRIASFGGSWKFIISFVFFILIWKDT